MERSIMLLIMVTGILYLILDEMIGSKRYISRFVVNTVPDWTLGEIITGYKPDPDQVILITPDGDPITVEEFKKGLEDQHV